MAYKNLLVHLDDTKACQKRVAAAIQFAEAQRAHLTGLAIAAEPNLPTFVYSQLPAEVLTMQRETIEERARSAAAQFAEAAKRSGINTDTRTEVCLQSDIAGVIGLHARYADLVIMGQADPEDPPASGQHLCEEVALSAGRPVLVVPYIGASRPIGRRVLVAWDAGREAARAVSDALPILTQAEQVEVLVVNPKPSSGGHGAEPGADIALHLARHGVTVEVRQLTAPDMDVGNVVLSTLSDHGSDLLVMGAYGHTRLRELILGGVTREIMGHMTVPVLLSH